MVGRTMFALISLSDLENDFINPYDLSSRLNRFVILEYVAQCVIVVTLLLSGKWFCGALHIGMLAYMVHSLVKRQHVVDATDVFKQLPAQKKKRFIMFGFFLATLVIVMYRLIESIIHGLLTPEGRATAKKLFKEAAASLHGY